MCCFACLSSRSSETQTYLESVLKVAPKEAGINAHSNLQVRSALLPLVSGAESALGTRVAAASTMSLPREVAQGSKKLLADSLLSQASFFSDQHAFDCCKPLNVSLSSDRDSLSHFTLCVRAFP